MGKPLSYRLEKIWEYFKPLTPEEINIDFDKRMRDFYKHANRLWDIWHYFIFRLIYLLSYQYYIEIYKDQEDMNQLVLDIDSIVEWTLPALVISLLEYGDEGDLKEKLIKEKKFFHSSNPWSVALEYQHLFYFDKKILYKTIRAMIRKREWLKDIAGDGYILKDMMKDNYWEPNPMVAKFFLEYIELANKGELKNPHIVHLLQRYTQEHNLNINYFVVDPQSVSEMPNLVRIAKLFKEKGSQAFKEILPDEFKDEDLSHIPDSEAFSYFLEWDPYYGSFKESWQREIERRAEIGSQLEDKFSEAQRYYDLFHKPYLIETGQQLPSNIVKLSEVKQTMPDRKELTDLQIMVKNLYEEGKTVIEISKIITEQMGYYFSRERVKQIIASLKRREILSSTHKG